MQPAVIEITVGHVAARYDAAAGPRPPLASPLRPPLASRWRTGGEWVAVDGVVTAVAVTLVLVSIGRHGVGYPAPHRSVCSWAWRARRRP